MQGAADGSWQASLFAFGLTAAFFIATNQMLMRGLLGTLSWLLVWPGLYVPVIALLLLPGVLLHELSHALGVLILAGGVTEISLLPQVTEGGRVRLGFVRYREMDPLRNILVGLMPIFAGSLALSLIISLGLRVYIPLRLAGIEQVREVVVQQLYPLSLGGWRPLLWWYLLFAIGNGMVPSHQDVEEWLSVVVFGAIVAAGLYLTGTGIPPLPTGLVRWCLEAVDYLTFALAGLAVVNFIVAAPLAALAFLLSALRGGEPA